MSKILHFKPLTKVQIAWNLRRHLRNRHGFKVQPKSIRPLMRRNENAIAWMDARYDAHLYYGIDIAQYRYYPNLWHFTYRKKRKYFK